MNDFFQKLKKYILKNQEKFPMVELAPHFKYDETTIISPSIANQIYSLYEQVITLQQLWEKEKDYSRLLKNENMELQEELNYMIDNDDSEESNEEELNSFSKEKEYLS